MALKMALLGPVLAAGSMQFTLYSQPIEIRYGEVYNKMQTDGNWQDHLLPKDVIERYKSGDRTMAIKSFSVDMIRMTPEGEETPVLLSDHYLHHYILYFGGVKDLRTLDDLAKTDKKAHQMLTSCHGMNGRGLRMLKNHLNETGVGGLEGVSFGSAAGAEYRHNPQRFEAPYRLLLHKPEAWFPTFHIINTRDDNRTVSPLLECPCSPQRHIDADAGTIDGKKPDPPYGCSAEFAETGNPSCSLSTYVGGWRCCEHEMFLIDTDKECTMPDCAEKPRDQVFMKFTFDYEDATSETRDIESGACCDTTGDNIEHDVPACPEGTPPEECIFVTESLQPVGFFISHPGHHHHHHHHHVDPHAGADLVDLVLAAPHLHWAGLSMELFDAETNESICAVHRSQDQDGGVMYGTGEEPGNEKGYLVGLSLCTWSGLSPKRFRRDHMLRARSVYNASIYHTGVMSLWLLEVSAVPADSTATPELIV